MLDFFLRLLDMLKLSQSLNKKPENQRPFSSPESVQLKNIHVLNKRKTRSLQIGRGNPRVIIEWAPNVTHQITRLSAS